MVLSSPNSSGVFSVEVFEMTSSFFQLLGFQQGNYTWLCYSPNTVSEFSFLPEATKPPLFWNLFLLCFTVTIRLVLQRDFLFSNHLVSIWLSPFPPVRGDPWFCGLPQSPCRLCLSVQLSLGKHGLSLMEVFTAGSYMGPVLIRAAADRQGLLHPRHRASPFHPPPISPFTLTETAKTPKDQVCAWKWYHCHHWENIFTSVFIL